jgi:hypothetical protein
MNSNNEMELIRMIFFRLYNVHSPEEEVLLAELVEKEREIKKLFVQLACKCRPLKVKYYEPFSENFNTSQQIENMALVKRRKAKKLGVFKNYNE